MKDDYTIKEILDRTLETLQTAQLGLADMKDASRHRRNPGLRNVIVFGRSVTFVLQNLRGKDARFEEWYLAKQTAMKADPIFLYFLEARNNLEKQGRLNVSTSLKLNSFSSADMARFEPRPPGATGFFIGDNLGGSGWEIELPNGAKEKYYMEIPSDIGQVSQVFSDTRTEKSEVLADRSVDDLAGEYLKKLSNIVDDARKTFLSEEPAPMNGGRRLPPFLRVVK
jgi:hypothetical protein